MPGPLYMTNFISLRTHKLPITRPPALEIVYDELLTFTQQAAAQTCSMKTHDQPSARLSSDLLRVDTQVRSHGIHSVFSISFMTSFDSRDHFSTLKLLRYFCCHRSDTGRTWQSNHCTTCCNQTKYYYYNYYYTLLLHILHLLFIHIIIIIIIINKKLIWKIE